MTDEYECPLPHRPGSTQLQSSNIEKNSIFVMFTVFLLPSLNNEGKYSPTKNKIKEIFIQSIFSQKKSTF